MKHLMIMLLFCSVALGQQVIQDPAQLVGKRVTVGRLPLCKPGSYTADHTRGGQEATVLSAKPGPRYPVSQRVMNQMTPEMQAAMLDQQKASLLLFQFADGAKLDTCLALGPKTLNDGLELAPGETLAEIPASAPTPTTAPAANLPPQDCPVAVTKVNSSDGGFGHALVDGLTTSEFERQMDRSIHGGNKHYLDMRMRNNSAKPIRAVESGVVYANVMGDESLRDTLVTQNKNPIKPGDEFKSYFMDRTLQGANGRGDVTVYITRIRFEDNTFWQDNGSHSCALTSRIK